MLILFCMLAALKLGFVAFVESENLAYIPDGLIFAYAIAGLVTKLAFKRFVAFGTICSVLGIMGLTISASLTGILFGDTLLPYYTSLLRTISPLLLLTLLLNSFPSFRTRLNSREYFSLVGLVMWIVSLVIYGAIFLPADTNRGANWMGTVFGGLHESAYTLLGAAFIAYAVASYQPSLRNRILHIGVALFTFLMLIFGWGVRTTGLAYILFFMFLAAHRAGIRPILTVSVTGVALAIGLTALFAFNLISVEYMVFQTSGRIAVYLEKLEFLSGNSATKWFLGNGLGSDLMHTDTWWWAPKGSHNDFLTFLTEFGIFSLIFLALALFGLFREIARPIARTVFLLSLATSLVSNGYLVRPAAAYGLVIAISLLSRHQKTQRWNKGPRMATPPNRDSQS